MRLIDADAFKDYIREACEDFAPLFDDNGEVARLITENFCYDIDEQPTIQPEPHWIPVTERLPEEEDSIFARYYGTDRWTKSMFRKKSREVIVTSVFEDGELHTEVAHTIDGEWHVGVNVVPRTVIAWMPLPEPFKGVTT